MSSNKKLLDLWNGKNAPVVKGSIEDFLKLLGRNEEASKLIREKPARFGIVPDSDVFSLNDLGKSVLANDLLVGVLVLAKNGINSQIKYINRDDIRERITHTPIENYHIMDY